MTGLPRSERDGGFTLLELMVVVAILGVVMAMAGGALLSMQNATVRTNAMVTDEQDASTTLAQMARDIRSAHAVEFPSSSTNAADAVILLVNQPSGSATPIEWVYTPATPPATLGTLNREVLTSTLGVSSNRVELTDVVNGSNPVFTYYNLFGAPMSTSPASSQIPTLQNCTTGIGVNLMISPKPTTGVSNFSESDEVAITDQQQILSAPGNQQCGVYTFAG